MANLTKPKIKLPDIIKAGETIEVRAAITHVMETGNRRDKDGQLVPRNVVNTFVARFGETIVFKASLGSGIAANPILTFPMRVPQSGALELSWTDDQGAMLTETVLIIVAD